MQKKIIALAVAALASTAAFAQTNVTIYGVADATFDNVGATGSVNKGNGDYKARNRVTSNSSYIGFKGVEDLGNGLKAVFQLENGVNFENGAAGAWNNRDSYVGLAGGFGVLVAGNVTGPTRALGIKLGIDTADTGIGSNQALLGKFGGALGGAGASAFDQRITNAVAYISPTFGGFNAVVGYSAGLANAPLTALSAENSPVGNQITGATAWTAGANFEAGPVYVGYAYTTVEANHQNYLVATATRHADNRLGTIVKLGTVGQIGLLWDQTKLNLYQGNVLIQDTYYVNGIVNFGKSKFGLQAGLANDIRGANQPANTGARNFSATYEYNLSKRTLLKATYAKIWNEERATYDFLYGVSQANSTATGAGVSAGADPRGISLGIRHSF